MSQLKRYVLTDTDDSMIIEPSNKRIQTKIWDVVAMRAGDNPIEQSGWVKTDKDDFFSPDEMKEFAENTRKKLEPYLNQSSITEIGIASGITCMQIAPECISYTGIDRSAETLKKTNQDIVIVNSVAQYFPGFNYFIMVMKKMVQCLKNNGIIFIGNIIDLDKRENRKRNTKDSNLLFPKKFFEELPVYVPQIEKIEITPQDGIIRNELTMYRYDVLIKINKQNQSQCKQTKFEYAMLSNDFNWESIEM